MTSLFVFFLVISILIVVHEFGHFIVARILGVRVEKFSLGFGPKLLCKKGKETEYSVAAFPLGGFVKLAGDNLEEYKGKPDEYLSKAPGKRFWIIACGPILNYILGIMCFWLIFFVGYPTLTSKVGGLVDDYGAKSAGIKTGDMVIAIEGKKVSLWEDMQRAIQEKKKSEVIKILVLRDNKEYTFNVAVKEKNFDDALGKKQSIALIGVMPSEDVVIIRHGFIESFVLSCKRTWDITAITYKALGRMLTAKLSIREATGPLGIFFLTSKVAQQGVIAVINLIGLISISLAIFNLLPFPVLDGGHIFLLAVEKMRGKYLSLKAEQVISQAGFSLIMLLAIVVTYNDIIRLFGDKIQKFFIK